MKINFSATHLSLRRRIWIAVSLVSIIPAVVILNYFFGYYVSSIATLILIFIIILGWWVIIEISRSIHKIHNQSRRTLRTIGEDAPTMPDEVQSLEEIINLLSSKVKTGFEELREFGHKTEQLNREVSKKVLILSTILQANDLYSKDTPAEEVVQFLTYHLKNLLVMRIAFCLLYSHYSDNLRVVSALGIDYKKIEDALTERENTIENIKKMVIVDKQNRAPLHLKWAQDLDIKNLMLFPVVSKGITIGLVGIGNNREDFAFQKDDTDVLNLFSQNVTLIWEYERVSSKVEELEMFDDLTGLYNIKMVKKRLNEEIRRGVVYQRPCGLVAVKIKNYEDFQKEFGTIEAEKAIKKVAKTIKSTIRPIDAGGRISSDALAVILIEKNRRQSQQVSDLLKENLEKNCSDKVKLDFCVAESPINGVTAEEILSFVHSKFK
ncbi:MAG: diguanylate cyclase [Candidatus Omnitrophica bacterium]|nr:diguanylate cyclase [Candidatus Omnitrophota bacterium]MCF7893725.1 diguanylate cyclase [Candidatus Omnitrophota bacterium]